MIYTTTLYVIGGNMGSMIHEATIVLLASYIESYDLNFWRLCNMGNLQVACYTSLIKLHFVVYLV